MSGTESELYFLIAKYLLTSPCQRSAQTLITELEQHSLLPQRIDWIGDRHDNTFEQISRTNAHISNDHLLKIAERIVELLNGVIPPSVRGVRSLLGDGRQSLLRTVQSTSALNSRKCLTRDLSRFRNGSQLMPCAPAVNNSKHPFNITSSVICRENSGPLTLRQLWPTKCYERASKYRRVLGHLSSVYCVAFDRTGRYIFTGADDSLVKIWCASDGRLLSTLRGHINEITDLSVNYENTLIAAGSCDKMIRVWCLKTTAPIVVLNGHNAQITSVKFCPLARDENRYLVSTANDGCVCFWRYNADTNEFNTRAVKFTERHKPGSQLVCSSFSAGGVFLAIGSTDNYLRVFHVTAPAGPTKILEIEQHSDQVDSLLFSNLSTRFVSGSRDGVAHIWYFERQHWHNIPLKMSERLPGSEHLENDEISRKLRVSMVGWSCDDVHVITSLSDHSLKVWVSQTGQLRHVLYGHEEEVFVIEAHPKDGRIILSGGHDGAIIIWDIISGTPIKTFFNSIDGQGHGAVFDCKFSPDGQMFASTDSHGHLTFFGLASALPYQKIPDQVFFHTDYRPVVRDNNNYVIDEQTQCAPHLMPPPFLVDIDGNPYPPELQRLVPGRENCSDSQLIPYVAVHNANGNDVAEVLAPVDGAVVANEVAVAVAVAAASPRASGHSSASSLRVPTIDDMIVRLQQEQQRLNHEHDYTARPPPGYHNESQSPRVRHGSQRARRSADARRTGDVEGVRQPANFISRDRELNLMVPIWAKKLVVNPLSICETLKAKQKSIEIAESEEIHFNKERKKRPQVEDVTVNLKLAIKEERFTRRKRRIIQQRQGVRHMSGRDRYSRRPDGRHHNGITDYENPEDLSDDSDSDYTGDQEWADNSSETTESETEDSEWYTSRPSTSRSRKRKSNNASNNEEDDRDEERDSDDDNDNDNDNDTAGPSTSKSFNGRKIGRKEKKQLRDRAKKQQLEEKYNSIVELPERFRPPEWFTDTHSRKMPYFAQIGDEVVYFRHGHQLYIDTVRDNKIYNINPNLKPHKIRSSASDEIFARITGIKYDVKPPRLVTLRLNIIDPDSGIEQTNSNFSVCYHDVENVVDFIILKQLYDNSIACDWKVGSDFRSIIDDKWWFGTITCVRESSPFSHFHCFDVVWANGDSESLSPWDLEHINEETVPQDRIESVSVTADEMNAYNVWHEDEWPECGKVEECHRISQGLIRIMEFSQAEEFAVPVDLNKHPVYGMMIAYPMDLSTIKSRVDNHYYRRVDAIKHDIKFIESNAREFNEAGSEIVKKAKIVCALCLRFLEDEHCYDPMPIYLDIIAHIEDFEEPELCNEDNNGDNRDNNDNDYIEVRRSSRRTRKENERKRKRSGSESDFSDEIRPKKSKKFKNGNPYKHKTWQQNCRELLDYVLGREDSSPFRSPVDPIQYPDYSQVIDTPMDLTTVKEQLLEDLYENPHEFCKDMRLIFSNSKSFNTNKRSRIYSMTVRLSSLFEEKMRNITSNYRSTMNYEQRLQRGVVTNRRKPLPISPISASNRRSPKKSPKKNRSVRGLSSSISPSFDVSQPSTSGYSSKSKSSHNNNKRSIKLMSTSSSSPKKRSVVNNKLRNSIINRKKNGNMAKFKRKTVVSVFCGKRSKRTTNNSNPKERTTERSVTIRSSSSRRSSRRSSSKLVVKTDMYDEDTEKETSFDFTINEDTMVNEEIVKHFDSDTEIEDNTNDANSNDTNVENEGDSDATEIDNQITEHNSIARKECSARSNRRRKAIRYSDHSSYTLPPHSQHSRSQRVVITSQSRRSRLKASEESESTQSSIASSSHSNYSNESHSTVTNTTLSHALSEASENSYMSEDNHHLMRRSDRKNRGIRRQWTTYDDSSDEMKNVRRVGLGLRTRRCGERQHQLQHESPIKTRTRNSGKKRVNYNYDDDDFEYDNITGNSHVNDAISSRGRIRKFRAHARHAN